MVYQLLRMCQKSTAQVCQMNSMYNLLFSFMYCQTILLAIEESVMHQCVVQKITNQFPKTISKFKILVNIFNLSIYVIKEAVYFHVLLIALPTLANCQFKILSITMCVLPLSDCKRFPMKNFSYFSVIQKEKNKPTFLVGLR